MHSLYIIVKMGLQAFISLATIIFIFASVNAQDCTALAAAGNCDFYPQCVETRIPCGSTGYALDYGNKYCRRLVRSLKCFNSEVYGNHVCIILVLYL